MIMQIMSNGIYKAPDHRAVANKSKQRLSIATFCNPNSSVDIGPAEKLINLQRYFNRKLEDSFIDSLKI